MTTETACDAIRSALGLGRAKAVADVIADEPSAHTLAAEVAAAKEPFDAAFSALDTLANIADALSAIVNPTDPHADGYAEMEAAHEALDAAREGTT